MGHLNCSHCGLSMSRAHALSEPEYCPRCLSRAGVAQPLFRSPLPMRDLVAGLDARSAAAASDPRAGRRPPSRLP